MRLRSTALRSIRNDNELSAIYQIAGEVPALHLSPRLRGNWTDLISGVDLTTFSRANTQPTYELDGAGGLVGFSSGQRAIGVSPETGIRGGSIFAQRTQLISDPTLATGWTATRATLTPNAATAPGGIPAALLVEDTTASNSHSVAGPSISFTSGTTYVFSGIAKAGPGPAARRIRLTLPSAAFTGGPAVILNLDLATVSVSGIASPLATFLYSLADGWYRWAVAAQATATASAALTIALNTSAGTGTYSGDGTSGVYITGANVTTGPVLFPYLGGAITCPADVLTIDGTNFSQWYQQAGGTLLVSASRQVVAGSDFARIATMAAANDDTNRWSLGFFSESTASAAVRTANVNVCDLFPTGFTGIRKRTLAGRFLTNDAAVSTNGGALSADTSLTLPTVNTLYLGASASLVSTSHFNGHIHDLLYWPPGSPAEQRLQQLSAAL